VGSALLGGKNFIDRARKVRKRWGGGMRQAGYLAAAALFALQHNRQGLKTDHEHLKALFDGISKMTEDGLPVTASLPEIWTNILYFTVEDADLLVNTLRQQGILMTHLGHGKIRAVTHLEITEKDITVTLKTLRQALSQGKKLTF
jgi:threonine aldolase